MHPINSLMAHMAALFMLCCAAGCLAASQSSVCYITDSVNIAQLPWSRRLLHQRLCALMLILCKAYVAAVYCAAALCFLMHLVGPASTKNKMRQQDHNKIMQRRCWKFQFSLQTAVLGIKPDAVIHSR